MCVFSDLFPYSPSLAKFLKSISIEFLWNSYPLKVSYLMISMDFARAGQLLSHFSWLPMTGISPWRANIKLPAYSSTLTKLSILSHIRLCSTNCTVCKFLLLIRWVEDYLSQHFQRVTLNGQCSTWLPVYSGVPQGSILGPLLFSIYINDLTRCSLSRSAKLLMFADDVLLYKPIETHRDFIAFQNDVDTITNWSHENHLSLNINKTKFMLISRSKQYSQCPQILLDGTQLEQVFHFKYLGV